MESKVTRTILRDNVKALCYDAISKETKEHIYECSTHFVDDKAALRSLKKEYSTSDWDILKVLDINTESSVYEMSRSDFLKYATKVESKNVLTNSGKKNKEKKNVLESVGM